MTFRVALVLDVRLIVTHGVTQACVALVVNDLEARPLLVVVGTNIKNAAAEILQHLQVLDVFDLRRDWVVCLGLVSIERVQ